MKYNYQFLGFILTLSLLFNSCTEDLPQLEEISDGEIIQGLKEALRVGTDTAVSIVSVTDGYFKDQAIKLLLPEEVSNAIATFKSKQVTIAGQTITGETLYTTGFSALGININPLQSKEDDLILGINRAAEAAAKDAGPIFWDAITGMSIQDGKDILFGGIDTAATGYLNTNTRPQLFNKFEPKIDTALGSVQVGGTSVVDLYEGFVGDYNDIVNTSIPLSSATVGSLMDINAIGATDLSEYSTNKGLNGLFLKVGDEEKKIRENPLHRVTSILEKVFGELDK